MSAAWGRFLHICSRWVGAWHALYAGYVAWFVGREEESRSRTRNLATLNYWLITLFDQQCDINKLYLI